MQKTENLILECLKELEKTALSKQIYKNYYEGKHSILKDYAMQDSRSNMKLVFNFPRNFVDNETGYLLGKPIILCLKLMMKLLLMLLIKI